MAFYSEKDQKRIGAALTALRSMEKRSPTLEKALFLLDAVAESSRTINPMTVLARDLYRFTSAQNEPDRTDLETRFENLREDVADLRCQLAIEKSIRKRRWWS